MNDLHTDPRSLPRTTTHGPQRRPTANGAPPASASLVGGARMAGLTGALLALAGIGRAQQGGESVLVIIADDAG